MKKQMKKRGFITKIIIYTILMLSVVVGFIFYQKYTEFFNPNVPATLEEEYVYIPTGASFEDVVNILVEHHFIMDEASFVKAAEKMNYKKKVMRAGRFKITPNWSNVGLIRHLRSGKQAPVKVILNNERLPKDVAGKIASFVEFDSLALWNLFEDTTYLHSIGYSKETLISLFIPNTYEFFWNVTPKDLMTRMIKENKIFWQKKKRLEKAQKLQLTPAQVYTLASIIEKETNQNSEKRRMAGVYLNRLKKGMPLQADPTCVFATGDFETKRVTNYHLQFESPYNTYLHAGLPPGPISMASIASIDAVLDAEKHDYIFFVAKGDGSGLHVFAKTLRGHNQNIAAYKRNLRKRR